MKRKLFIVLVTAILTLGACSDSFQPDDYSKEVVSEGDNSAAPESICSYEKRSENFIDNFSQDYPAYELLNYVFGSEDNIPIQLVAIAQNKETGLSSTLFVLDKNGVGQVVLASEYLAYYRKEDGLRLDKNVISISLELIISDTNSEIHDFNITVTQEENQGTINTVYASQETIRNA